MVCRTGPIIFKRLARDGTIMKRASSRSSLCEPSGAGQEYCVGPQDWGSWLLGPNELRSAPWNRVFVELDLSSTRNKRGAGVNSSHSESSRYLWTSPIAHWMLQYWEFKAPEHTDLSILSGVPRYSQSVRSHRCDLFALILCYEGCST